jgi:putative ABC transport system permease protein
MTAPGRASEGRLVESVYRALLRLYPRPFRREFEPLLIEAFHDRRRSARDRFGRAGFAALWIHIVRDLWTSVRAERHRAAGGGTGKPDRPTRGDHTPRRSRFASGAAGLRQDFRYALRGIRRQPGFAALAIGIVALGIGGNTAVFSVVNGVLLAALPYGQPERILRLWANEPAEGIERFSFTKVEYRHFFENNEVFDAIGGDFPLTLTATGDGAPERLRAAFVTPGYFEVFGVHPLLGRFVTFDDIDAENLDVAVLSHGFWQRRLGGDANAVGRTLLLNGRSVTVLGVLPRGYRHLSDDYDIFVPYTRGTGGWIGRWLELSAKLAPGVTIEQAQANLDAMLATVAEEQERSSGWAVSIEPLDEWAIGATRNSVLAMAAAVLLLLLLACANVANLMLARAATRQRETAIRLSLGASRAQVVRQSLVEGLILGVAGGAAGVLLAFWAVPLLLALGAHAVPRLSTVGIDLRVLIFAVAVSVGSGTLFGMAPAWYAARLLDAERSLRGGSSSVAGKPSAQRPLHGLVVVEVALALTLLVGAGMLLQSFRNLRRVELGVVDGDRVAAVSIALPAARYPEAANTHAFFDELTARVGALPGVESASLSAYLPLGGRAAVGSMISDHFLEQGGTELVASLQRFVRNDYFRTVGVPLRSGRLFDERLDDQRPRQVIISESMARRLWPGIDPVGRRMTWRSDPTSEQWLEVIGVVGDVRYETIDGELTPQYYESHYDQSWREMYLVARTDSPLADFVASVRSIVRGLDADVPVSDATTIGSLVSASMAAPRFNLLISVAFATTALILACAGIYGVISFVVRQQTREIGIRKAVGASQPALRRWVLRRAAALVAAGVALGIALALATSRLLASLLFGVDAVDPLVYTVGAVLLAAIALIACGIPATRASRVDPIVAMRDP